MTDEATNDAMEMGDMFQAVEWSTARAYAACKAFIEAYDDAVAALDDGGNT